MIINFHFMQHDILNTIIHVSRPILRHVIMISSDYACYDRILQVGKQLTPFHDLFSTDNRSCI